MVYVNVVSHVPKFTSDVVGQCPNITGVFGRLSGLNGSDPGTFAGAFKVNGATNMSHGGDSGATNARNASFDASRSSATYGAISTVQPPAALMLACIRI